MKNQNSQFDTIIVGGGHNGLVCAIKLAKRKQKVLVLEANSQFGGAAVTRDITKGYQAPTVAHLLHAMPEKLRTKLRLEDYGLKLAEKNLSTIALATDGRHAIFANGTLQGASSHDIGHYSQFHSQMQRFAALIAPILAERAPRLGRDKHEENRFLESLHDRIILAKVGLKLRLMGRHQMQELLRIVGMNAHDLMMEHFDTPLVQGAIAFDAVLGGEFGPRTPGTVLSYLYRLAGQVNAGSAPLAAAYGAMGGVTAALVKAAEAAGVTLRSDSRVKRIIIEQNAAAFCDQPKDKNAAAMPTVECATGIELADGTTIHANIIVSNLDTKSTFLSLVGSENLDTDFVRRVINIHAKGRAAKVNLALKGLPNFIGLDPSMIGQRLLIAPDIHVLERAFDAPKYGEFTTEPCMEIFIPSISDPQLAPPGHHVVSAIVLGVPDQYKGGWTASARKSLLATVVKTMENYAPELGKLIVASELLTPTDLETQFNMPGGCWHHGGLTLDQFYFTRPTYGATQYRAPIKNLYLCGASNHPGGGVMGLAGSNAADEILRSYTKKRS